MVGCSEDQMWVGCSGDQMWWVVVGSDVVGGL